MIKPRAYFWLLLLLSLPALPQDEVLLTIDNQPVMRSEFERVYRKNNSIQGLEIKTPAEYLELFVNFKLKVHEAMQLGYDTLASFRKELAGYRDQLAKPYLQDRPLIDSMLHEAYYRMVNEANASHIMVKLPPNPAPADTLAAYERAMEIRSRLMAGAAFDEVAREVSDDPSAKTNGGYLGWFSAFAMVLPFENAVYGLKAGELSVPVRSRYGYHIIRLNDIRPSLGEIKLAHIMTRAARNESTEVIGKAKDKINECFQMLQKGVQFADAVKQYSEDPNSSQSGGQMRWLRSGELPPDIEKIVFALPDIGKYTVPVQSDYGWHIFILEGLRPIAPYDELKKQLEERIMSDERGKKAEESLISRLKSDYGFVSYTENISALASILDSSVYAGNWSTAMANDLIEPVFAIGSKEYNQKDLASFVAQTKRYRLNESFASIVQKKCNELINKELISHEKSRLEEKYPDFRFLMEEYHDGILLFNIMDERVWAKAVHDTIGLKEFYAQHTLNYMWKERAGVSVYDINDISYLKTARSLARKRIRTKWQADEMIKMICRQDTFVCVDITDHTYERGDSLQGVEFKWKKGYVKVYSKERPARIIAVNEILPPAPKTFNESRGQVTADYQNFLDQQWIGILRVQYPVSINQSVMQQIH
jgi:peptidyl-prolyl cis-trans isomerase SurA